jgi:hypothetical protein
VSVVHRHAITSPPAPAHSSSLDGTRERASSNSPNVLTGPIAAALPDSPQRTLEPDLRPAPVPPLRSTGPQDARPSARAPPPAPYLFGRSRRPPALEPGPMRPRELPPAPRRDQMAGVDEQMGGE